MIRQAAFSQLEAEPQKIRRYRLIIVDEVGYIPLRPGCRQPVLAHHAEVLTLSGDSYRARARRELLAKDRSNGD